MDTIGNWNVEDCRNKYEPNEHWELKKEFMLRHQKNIPKDRLVCLAQTYANITLMGCRYSNSVMKEVMALADGLGQKYLESRQNKLSRTFVKASDAVIAKIHRKRLRAEADEGNPKKRHVFERISFDSSTPQSSTIYSQNNSTGAATNSENIFSRNVQTSKKQQIIFEKLQKLWSNNDLLSKFIILTNSSVKQCNAFNVLVSSASASDMTYEIIQSGFSWIAKIDGINVMTIDEICSKKLAMSRLSCGVLKLLCSKCCLLEVKSKHSSSSTLINTNDIATSSAASTAAPVSNLASKLMKMMGWSGGGIGKHGQGIVDPIEPSALTNRQGLGYDNAGVTKDFQNNAIAFISKFAKNFENGQTSCPDMIFSPNFTKEQRAFLHKQAARMNLKSRSTGKGLDRYLVLSVRMNVRQRIMMSLQNPEMYDHFSVFLPGTYTFEEKFINCN